MVQLSATLSYRVNQAIPYLLGAARYSRLVGQVEAANANSQFGEFWEEMRDHAVSCVFFADAAIESYANELFADAPKVFPSQFIPGLELLWDELERRKSSLDKLDLALSLKGKPRLDRKLPILKSVYALGRLRNELTHFKPEWSHDPKKHINISNDLEGFFTTSVWFKNETIFPRAWIGHSCTVWAVQTSVGFLKEFEKLADLTDRTDWKAFESRLTP
jgi:hypothetical protein